MTRLKKLAHRDAGDLRSQVHFCAETGHIWLHEHRMLLVHADAQASLRKELVDSRQMSEKAFHDEILRQGSMPIALVRLALTKQKLTRDMEIDWKFYGDLD